MLAQALGGHWEAPGDACADGLGSLLPSGDTIGEWRLFYDAKGTKKLQRKLVGVAESALAECVWVRAGRLRASLEQEGAASWPSVASSGDTYMEDRAFKLTTSLRLGLPPPARVGPCQCGAGGGMITIS